MRTVGPFPPPAVSAAPPRQEGALAVVPVDRTRAGNWLRNASLGAEAAIFLLLVFTCAALLGQNAVTRQRFVLTPESGKFAPYAYTDHDSGGSSTLTFDDRPLSWSCSVAKGFAYPYCAYGMVFDSVDASKGHDLSHYETITLRFAYHGPRGTLKLVLKNFDPKYSRVNAGDTTKPNVAEFPVTEGENEIHLTPEQFAVDQWWVTSHNLKPEQAKPEFRNIVAIDVLSGSQVKLGKFSVAVHAITFEGTYLSPEQWYLVIIGVWLVLTGLFLVYRMLRVKRGYEARQRRQAAESRELDAARAAAEAANAAKTQFLANMTHELRTPLNAILGYAQLLKGDGLSDRQSSAVRTINQSGEHLLGLINDLLDLSKVEAGRLELLTAPFDIRVTVEDVAEMIRGRAEEKGLRFTVVIGDNVPRHLVGDQKRIRQVLINLLGNAIKFTAEGDVRLEVSAISWGGGDVRLRFDVIDTGAGIAQDQLANIFEPFEQAGSAMERGGGTGLGLSITREIVQVCEGEISVDSSPGVGSRFRVEAPFPLAAPELPEPELLAAPPARAQGATALVVDDSAVNRSFLRDALEARGLAVCEADDGLEAIDLVESAEPDVIVMDLNMPVLGGLAAIRRLQQRAALRSIPIIAISGAATAQAEADARAAGADRFLAKPFGLEQLYRCVEELLDARREETSAAPGEGEPLALPSSDQMARLLDLARAGNMRAVRNEAAAILAQNPQCRPFVEQLETLAAAYQSPAVLRLIEQHIQNRKAA